MSTIPKAIGVAANNAAASWETGIYSQANGGCFETLKLLDRGKIDARL